MLERGSSFRYFLEFLYNVGIAIAGVWFVSYIFRGIIPDTPTSHSIKGAIAGVIIGYTWYEFYRKHRKEPRSPKWNIEDQPTHLEWTDEGFDRLMEEAPKYPWPSNPDNDIPF